jgi:hypothetical protein
MCKAFKSTANVTVTQNGKWAFGLRGSIQRINPAKAGTHASAVSKHQNSASLSQDFHGNNGPETMMVHV